MHNLVNHKRRPPSAGFTQAAITEQSLPVRNDAAKYDRRLQLVLMLIEQNIQSQLAIRDLAAAVNLSPGRLAHLFKNEVGVSPQRYLNHMRLEGAKELLENGMLSVKEVAAKVGFPNVSSFCRSFKASYGKTPKEYRKTHLRIDLKSLATSTASFEASP
jgi:transcriptional regulator GlxA family with amidase domain